MPRNDGDGRGSDLRTPAARRSGPMATSAPQRRDAPSPEETLRLVHELQVHKIELEMQNEDLRRAQEELEASRLRYFDLYDQAPVGYVTLSGQGSILEANLSAAALLGVERTALANRPFLGFVHPADRDIYHAQRAQLGEDRPRHSWDMRMARADGAPCWAHLRAALTRNGECRITLNDISERKRVEERLALADDRLRQMQKAESLERMAGAIAHHFNNNLHAVTGNLELALDGPAGGTESAGHLREAMQASVRAAEMSALLLAFVGQTDGSRAQFDLSQGCTWTLPLLRASLPAEVPLETEFQPPGPVVTAHADQIQQVLINLVTNAGDAVGRGGGAVRLAVTTIPAADIPEAHRFPLDWEPRGEAYACLEVTDTGRGIAGNELERIFEPFYTDKVAGRGLGLSVVLGIVRAHLGAVSVQSEPGRGSSFRVFLPLSTGSAAPALKKPTEFEAGGVVLVVEDEDLVRRVFSAQLKRLGFTVLDASGGSEAAEMFGARRDEIRLVLCDLSMPGMNGWETLAVLRKLAPGIPVILTSGYDRTQVMAGSHPELPQAFLRKPYGAAELGEAVRLALGGAVKGGKGLRH